MIFSVWVALFPEASTASIVRFTFAFAAFFSFFATRLGGFSFRVCEVPAASAAELDPSLSGFLPFLKAGADETERTAP